jgi:hypothetical protein
VPTSEVQFPAAAPLGAIGQLRECVAAARNLEQLVSASKVGPQVLAHVVPDVARQLGEFAPVLIEILRYVTEAGVPLTDEERAVMVESPAEKVSELLVDLNALTATPIHAKVRLALERELLRLVPNLDSSLAHCELLLDSCQSAPSEMTIRELLTSIPERGSDRPYRPIAIGGEGLERLVTLSPRVALKLISAWMSTFSDEQPEITGLLVQADDREASFTIQFGLRSGPVARLPVFPPASYTSLVVAAVLRPYGGKTSGSSLIFPSHS